MTIDELRQLARSWSTCRECDQVCDGPLGLHRHVRAAHTLSAWDYYQRHRVVMLLRALDGSDVAAMGLAHVIGPCWLHRGAPDRWGARLRVAGAPTQALYRLTFWAVHAVFPRGYACHACDTPQCCNPLHVWDGSARDNARDRERKGRGADRRKVSKEQAHRMRRLYQQGSSYRDLGRRFGVGAETARRAVLALVEQETATTAAELDGEVPW